jgi:hypothetical protein
VLPVMRVDPIVDPLSLQFGVPPQFRESRQADLVEHVPNDRKHQHDDRRLSHYAERPAPLTGAGGLADDP